MQAGHFLQIAALLAALAFLAFPELEARGIEQQLAQQDDETGLYSGLLNTASDPSQLQALLQTSAPRADVGQLDPDEEEEEERVEAEQLNYNQAPVQAGSANHNQAGLLAPSSVDLKPAASKHYHHGHGAKGWLDMGAWTGKKGAFGWYDKHPVGKKGK